MPSVNIPVDFLQILDNQYNARKQRDTISMNHLKAENSILLSRHKRYTSALALTLPNGNDSLSISIGFIFDGYQKYSNINDALPDTRILIYSYPEIDFTKDIVEFDPEKDEFISIKVDFAQTLCDFLKNLSSIMHQLLCLRELRYSIRLNRSLDLITTLKTVVFYIFYCYCCYD